MAPFHTRCLDSWLLQVLSRFWQLGPWSFRWNVWRPPPSTNLKVASNLIIWKIFNISWHFDSRAFVASLPREKVSCAPDEEQQCPICLKAVEEGDRYQYQFYRKHSSSYSYHTNHYQFDDSALLPCLPWCLCHRLAGQSCKLSIVQVFYLILENDEDCAGDWGRRAQDHCLMARK